MPNRGERRALVTGATGFIGRHLVDLLLTEGWEVHAVVRPSSVVDTLPPEVTPHVDDGSVAALQAAVDDPHPTVCFHLAGLFVATHDARDVSDLVAANIDFGARLAEAVSLRPGTLFVNAGSYWQHVGGAAYRPAALYAATKQALEDILRYYADAELLRVVNLKIHDTYGPGDTRRKLLTLLLDAAATGEPIVTSGGNQLIDLVHVDDVARAFVVAAETFATAPQPIFESYAVSSGAPISLRALAARVEAVSRRSVDVKWGARPYRRHEMFEPWDAGHPLPGWSPTIRLEDGIASAWQRCLPRMREVVADEPGIGKGSRELPEEIF